MSFNDLNDGELLALFAHSHEQPPFAEIVRRHQALVLSVCRRLTHHEHDAEDAAQRVFLTLAKKASLLAHRESLSGWLFRAARHAGRDVRRARLRRQKHEEAVPTTEAQDDPTQGQHEWREVLDGKLADLPHKYREPIVLHHLQGMPQKQAAQRMGLAEGAFSVRLSRGRQMLLESMTRSGLTFSIPALAVFAPAEAWSAEVPAQTASKINSLEFHQQAVLQLESGRIMISRFKIAAVFLALMLSVAGTAYALTQNAANPSVPTANAPKPAKPVQKAEVQKQLAGNTQYAVNLYAQLMKENAGKNLAFSPYSISGAFGMQYAGSDTTSQKEIANTLKFQTSPARFPWIFQNISRDLMSRAKDNKMALNIANALVLTGGGVREEFKEVITDKFNGEVVTGSNPLETVNNWAKEKTEGKIEKILEELSPDSVCVVLNAIYFKSAWNSPFNSRYTRDMPFNVTKGDAKQVPTMSKDSAFAMLREKNFQAIDLPYKGKEFSMVVFLPNKQDGLNEFEKSLNTDNLNKWLAQLDKERPGRVELSLPKFKVESSFNLVPTCKAMGIKDSFASGADFSGIKGTPGEIFISQVVHKGVVEVNERGTEAAGVTAIESQQESLPPQFRANHPFVFVIRDKKSGSILFMGRVMDPTAEG